MAAALAEVIELFPDRPIRTQSGGTVFERQPDGAEIIYLNPSDSELAHFEVTGDEGFSANLAARLTASQRHGLAQKLIEYARVDLESRKSWEDLSHTALKLLGIERVDPTSLPFPGAASIQHPIIAECCVQFQSHAIEEFFPATGPVKGHLAGKATEAAQQMVQRAQDFMNYYLTTEDPEYYADTDQMLFYLPIAGSVFRKVWIDPRDGLPRARYVKAEDFIAPYFARDLRNCPRYAHRYPITGAEIRRAMARGEFIELDLPEPPAYEQESEGRRIEDVADRRQRVLHEDDELYEFYEYHVELNLPEGIDELDDGARELPYVITVDATSQEILAVRRNWREDDPNRIKRVWFTHYKFFPGLGFYGWGFLHILGSLADAISGSVRALLDSALMATLQGGFRAKDGVKKAGSLAVIPGRWQDVDATIDELAKTFYTPPFKEPSPALPAVITALLQDARRFASLTEVLVGQADNKAPVGTTIALIEQSLKLFTAIHKRIFAAAREEFRMLAELIHDYGPYDEYPYFLGGEEKYALREDFDPTTVDFIPVADPNITSDVQRISMAQAVIELMRSDPQLYGPEERVEAHRRFLQALKIPDWERLAPKLPRATYLDPIGENAIALLGKPIRAFPGQRHDLHISAHLRQIEIARNTLPPDQFEPVYFTLMAHVREHEALSMIEQVSARMQQTLGVPLPPIDIYNAGEDLPPELEMAITIAAAQALPPIPEPRPGSVAAQTSQGDAAAAAKAAEQQRVTEAKNAEAIAKIERDTVAFIAEQRRSELAHQQQLRQEAERHAAEMARMDESAVAEILRANASARSRIRESALTTRSRIALEAQRERARALERSRAPLTRGRPAARKRA